jgi:hypothetical protein
MRVEEIVSSLLSKIEDVQNKRITAQADLLDALGRFQLAKESEEEAINTQALSAGEISSLRAQLLQFNEQEMAYKEQLKHFQALLSLAQPPAEEPAPEEQPPAEQETAPAETIPEEEQITEEPVTDPTAEENPAEGELPLDDPPLPAEEEIPPVEGDGGGL